MVPYQRGVPFHRLVVVFRFILFDYKGRHIGKSHQDSAGGRVPMLD
jgi:hypothetical protein